MIWEGNISLKGSDTPTKTARAELENCRVIKIGKGQNVDSSNFRSNKNSLDEWNKRILISRGDNDNDNH